MAIPQLPSVKVRVPAKVNLSLAVGKPGADGFHPLATLFQAVSLYDDITASWAEPGTVSLEMNGEGSELLPTDDSNLAVRAAVLLREAWGGSDKDQLGVHLVIKKGIPIAGGMAGGSADAAGVLVACAQLWDIDIASDELRALGAKLGSDVPFALLGGTAVGTGRGDLLAPALSRGTYHWVIALADEGLSTPAVFRRFDEMGLGVDFPEVDPALMAAIAGGNAERVGNLISNDLERASFNLRPELKYVIETGLKAGACGAVVSGSGPTCAFLAVDETSAIDVSTALVASELCHSVRRVQGPVPGARVIF